MPTISGTQIAVLTSYSHDFLYSVCQSIASNQSVLQNAGFVDTVKDAYVELKNAQTAGLYSDQQAAQCALDRIKYLSDHKTILL